MNRCRECDRFLMGQERACPFCGATQGSLAGRVGTTVAAGVTMMVLAACYGAPPGDKIDSTLDSSPDSGVDADGDGFTIEDDCDDGDAAVNPGAAEVCDDSVDNDCDGLIDADDGEDCGG